jgi:DNA-binding IclR family transcriptional regulator
MGKAQMEYHVPSVWLAAQVLKLLSRHKYKCCSLKDIASKLDASPTTCLRVLRTLEAENFVYYDSETKKYSLGPYLIPLGNRAAELNDAVAQATAEIKRIASVTGFTTVLIQRWDDRLVYTASAEPPAEGVRLSISVGQQIPMTSGAHGRCFLAFDDETELQRLISKGLRPVTSESITDPYRFLEAVREVRRNGYALSHGEIKPGFSAVDVPIFSKSGGVELVISSMFVSSQMAMDQLADLISLLVTTSRKLSEWNGYGALGVS